MKRNHPTFHERAFVIAFVALLAGAPAAAAQTNQLTDAVTATDARWGTEAAPIEAGPGDVARVLTITVQNTGTTTYASVRATLGAAGGLTPSSTGGRDTLGSTFATNAAWDATFRVDVASSAKVGETILLPLSVALQQRGSNWEEIRDLTVPVVLPGRAILSADVVPGLVTTQARSGIEIAIRNVGTGTAGSVTLLAAGASPSQLSVAGDGLRSLGPIAPGGEARATFAVDAGPAGTFPLALDLAYTNAAGVEAKATRSVLLRAVATDPDTLGMTLASHRLFSGRAGTLTFDVENRGNVSLENARVTFSLPSGASVPLNPVNGSDVRAIGTLAPGERLAVPLDVLVAQAAADLYSVTATVEGTDPHGNARTHAFRFGVLVLGTIDPAVTSASATYNNATRQATVTATLTNLGNTRAYNVQARLVGDTNYAATELQYLGDLSPQDALPFTMATTLLNESFASGGSRPPGFPGRANGTFPQGGGRGQAGPGVPGAIDGAGPPGGVRGNFTGQGAPGGAFARTGQSVRILVTWNDEYGTVHERTFAVSAPLRTATVTTRGGPAGPSSALGVPGFDGAWLAIALVATALVASRRRE